MVMLSLRYELMFCDVDSEELLDLVSKAGGVSSFLHDAVHLSASVVLPVIREQMQVRELTQTPSAVVFCATL